MSGLRVTGYLLAVCASLLVTSCGGGSSPASPKYTVGGVLSGFSGNDLVLQNNGGDDLSIAGNGSFVFATALASGTAYSVTVKQQSTSPAENCIVLNAGRTGIVQNANVTGVTVNCRKIARFAYAGYYDSASQPEPATVALGIDPTSGMFTQLAQSPTPVGMGIASPLLAGGIFAYAPAYAAGGVPGVAGFRIDPASGSIATLPGSPYGLGIVPPAPNCGNFCLTGVEVTQFAMDARGQYLYAYFMQWGPGSPSIPVVSTIVGFRIDQNTGALTVIANPAAQGGKPTLGLTIDPAGRFLYSLEWPNSHIGDPGGIRRFLIDASTGGLSDSGIDRILTAFGVSVSFEPRGEYGYIGDSSTGAQALAVDPTSGALRQIGSAVAAPLLTALTVDPAGAFAYSGCIGGICGFSLDAVGGGLTALPGSPFVTPLGPSPQNPSPNPVIDPSGKFLLVICGTEICVYALDPSTGIPTLMPGSPFAIAGVSAPVSLVLVAE